MRLRQCVFTMDIEQLLNRLWELALSSSNVDCVFPRGRNAHYEKNWALNSMKIDWNRRFSRKTAEPLMKISVTVREWKYQPSHDSQGKIAACRGHMDDARKIIPLSLKLIPGIGKSDLDGDSNACTKNWWYASQTNVPSALGNFAYLSNLSWTYWTH